MLCKQDEDGVENRSTDATDNLRDHPVFHGTHLFSTLKAKISNNIWTRYFQQEDKIETKGTIRYHFLVNQSSAPDGRHSLINQETVFCNLH